MGWGALGFDVATPLFFEELELFTDFFRIFIAIQPEQGDYPALRKPELS